MLSYFSVVVCLRWLYHRMLSVSYFSISQEIWILRLSLLCSLMMCANNRVHYGLMVVYGYLHITLPHHHHHSDLSEGIELLKCLSDIFCLECVSKIRSVPSIIFYAIYRGLCVLSLPISLKMIAGISCYHNQIGSMTHFQLFKVR